MLSIIIPTYNESGCITQLIEHLIVNAHNQVNEIIVVDGGSTDETCILAKKAGATLIQSQFLGRASQMNEGAKIATGEVLYFVHADSLPPKSFARDIKEAIRNNYQLGCYRFKFDSQKVLLKINAYFTRFDRLMCRGGDQTLFVKKQVFEQIGGYRSEFQIMEEYDFLIRARKKHRFKIIPKDVLVSARKYDNNNYFRVNFTNLVVFIMFYLGCSQLSMIVLYQKFVKSKK
jgi:rSAM/selenodomain-associated transferase 2